MQSVHHHVRQPVVITLLQRKQPFSHRALLMERLEVAKRKVKLGQDQIDQQYRLIATLFASGEERDEAENRLRVYQKLQKNYVADVERLADMLQHTFL